MKSPAIGFLVLTTILLAASQVSAEPYDEICVSSVNLSGGDPLPEGSKIYFGSPSIYDWFFLQAGYFDLQIGCDCEAPPAPCDGPCEVPPCEGPCEPAPCEPGIVVEEAGRYLYYPFNGTTIFSGVTTNEGVTIAINGVVLNDTSLFAWVYVSAGDLAGWHYVTGDVDDDCECEVDNGEPNGCEPVGSVPE